MPNRDRAPSIEPQGDARLILSVPCRHCRAEPGICCRSVNGNVTPYPHLARINDAQVPGLEESGYLEYATAVVLGREATPDELELARQRGISYGQPWVEKALRGLDVNRRIDQQRPRSPAHDPEQTSILDGGLNASR